MIQSKALCGLRTRSIGNVQPHLIVSSRTASHHVQYCGRWTPLLLQHPQGLPCWRPSTPLAKQAPGPGRQRASAASRQAAAAASSQVAVFPAGRKQAKVTLPAFIVIVSATEVLQRRDSIAEEIGAAISEGATGILLGDAQGLGEHRSYPRPGLGVLITQPWGLQTIIVQPLCFVKAHASVYCSQLLGGLEGAWHAEYLSVHAQAARSCMRQQCC